jgi:soluble lytic murein transglycosylase-like protein
MLARWLFCSACWALPWLSPEPAAASPQYDLWFQRWGNYYFAGHDWHWWKAQGIAESALNPQARSYCGAIGLMQLMPATAGELGVNPYDPEANIQGGVKYDRQLWDGWQAIESHDERRRFVFASYNAGPGNIRRARKLAGGTVSWSDVAARLSTITGKLAQQTVTYVQRIQQYYQAF